MNIAAKLHSGEVLVPYLVRSVNEIVEKHGMKYLEDAVMDAKIRFMADDRSHAKKVVKNDGDYYGKWHHLSAVMKCMSYQWYRMLGAPPINMRSSDSFREWQIFGFGEDRHMAWQCLMEALGLMKGREDKAAYSSLSFMARGKTDGIIRLPFENRDRLFELKTINTRRFALLKKADKPNIENLVQANGYMFFMGLEVASIVYEEKATHETKEFSVEFDPELFDWMVQSRMFPLEAHLADLSRPPRENATKAGGPSRECGWCEFAHICFSDRKTAQFLEEKFGNGTSSKEVTVEEKGSKSKLRRAKKPIKKVGLNSLRRKFGNTGK